MSHARTAIMTFHPILRKQSSYIKFVENAMKNLKFLWEGVSIYAAIQFSVLTFIQAIKYLTDKNPEDIDDLLLYSCYSVANCLFPKKNASKGLHSCNFCNWIFYGARACIAENFENNEAVLWRRCIIAGWNHSFLAMILVNFMCSRKW